MIKIAKKNTYVNAIPQRFSRLWTVCVRRCPPRSRRHPGRSHPHCPRHHYHLVRHRCRLLDHRHLEQQDRISDIRGVIEPGTRFFRELNTDPFLRY